MTVGSVIFVASALLHIVVVGGVGLRVIWVRRPAGSAFAWLLLVSVLPFAGLVLYMLFGERPIGRQRLRRAHAFYGGFPTVANSAWALDVADPAQLVAGPARAVEPGDALYRPAGAAAARTLALHAGAETILRAIIDDIDTAKRERRHGVLHLECRRHGRRGRGGAGTRSRHAACAAACCSTRWAARRS